MNVTNYVIGDPKYKVKNLPIAATFITRHKSQRIVLKPVQSKMVGDTEMSIPNSGLKIKFQDHSITIHNREVLEMLLAHKNFDVPKYGFYPDEDDATGFWAALNVVKTEMIPVKKMVEGYKIEKTAEGKLGDSFKAKLDSMKKVSEPAEESESSLSVTEKASYTRAKVKVVSGDTLTPLEQAAYDKAKLLGV